MGGIILFDGVCNFCDASVQFIIKRDPHGYFQFASIQSEVGQELLTQYQVPAVDSLILIENGNVFVKSTAALKIARRLNGGWPLAYSAIIVPPLIRHALYDVVAKNRYKWFGKKDACMLPTKEQRKRFL